MHAIDVQTRKFTRDEYYQLGEMGWFAGQRVMLLDGEIIQMAPMGFPHALTLDRVRRLLEAIFEPACWVRTQLPMDIEPHSQLLPEISVVRGAPKSHRAHPTTALLVVEIADSTLRADRQLAGRYASAGVAEYWIVNLPQKQVEVHRQPMADPTADFGHTYAERRVLSAGQSVAPLELPDKTLSIANFFD